MQEKFDSEPAFEAALVEALTSRYGWQTHMAGLLNVFKGATEADLRTNLARILFLNNRDVDRLNNVELTETEIGQVIDQINALPSSLAANEWVNGKEVSITRDNPADTLHCGASVTLHIFDRDEIAAGRSFYQIVRQPDFPTPHPLASDRRGDMLLLINGLPLFHVELKRSGVAVSQAANQIQKYAHEGVFSNGLLSLVQVFVAMTPEETLYFANPGKTGVFKPEFFFHWEDLNNEPVNKWFDVAEKLLSIPRAHEMIGYFTVADKGDGVLKVMRSYQVIAAEQIVGQARKKDWYDVNPRGGYVWHTTGSGKTMTSFKSAQLIANGGTADKVVFLVDRIELGTQSFEEYCGFADPETTVNETDDTKTLVALLKSTDRNKVLIVTSIQKMSLVNEANGTGARDIAAIRAKKIAVIVDECHRSVFGEMMRMIRETFPKALFFGFTGTPIHVENGRHGNATVDVFGDEKHRYTIADGIRDHNVLGFDPYQVFTYKDRDLREQVAFARLHVSSVDEIRGDAEKEAEYHRIMSQVDMIEIEAEVPSSQYDRDKHHQAVVVDVRDNFDRISAFGKFHGILATSSIPEAIDYYRLFKKMVPNLKVAALFDSTIDNDDPARASDKETAVLEMLGDYNARYSVMFRAATYDKYKKDVALRLAHKKAYRNIGRDEQLDLLIVVSQMLTGFDSKWVNVLYLDKMLEHENIIQAFSRTNRIFGPDKPYGIIRYYRRPHTMKQRIDAAIGEYSGNRPFGVSVDRLPENLETFNALAREIKQLFAQAGIPDFSALPNDIGVRGRFAQLFSALHRRLLSMKPQGFVWGMTVKCPLEKGKRTRSINVEIDEETYAIWLQRYQEIPKRNGTNSGALPFDIDPYLTETQTGIVNHDYINSRFSKYLKVLGSGGASEQTLLDELHRSFAVLSQNDQTFARLLLNDVQSGNVKVEDGVPFMDYVRRYILQARNDRTHQLAVGLGINEDALRDLAEQHPTAATINVNGRYDALLTAIDRDKAKAFIEKELGAEIKPREVVRESDTLFREFLIG